MNSFVKRMAAFGLTAFVLVAPVSSVQSQQPVAGLTLRAIAANDDDYARSVAGKSIFDGMGRSSEETSTVTANRFTSAKFPYSAVQKAITEHSAINKDVKAWLMIPNTNINRPVTFSSQDNNYYVYRDWRGTNYPNTTYQNYPDTATYMDFRTVLGNNWNSSSKNIVIYGHNWNNLRNPMVIGDKPGYLMFAQLPSYTNIDFAKTNAHIYFSSGENEGIWRVFAAGYCELSAEFFYNNPSPTTNEMQSILNEWKQRSLFNFDVDVNTNDRLLTLSTCTRQFDAGSMQRYVVVARLLRDGETENDIVNVTVNPSVKQPKFDAQAAAQAAS